MHFNFNTGLGNMDIPQFILANDKIDRQPELLVKMPSPIAIKNELRYATHYLTNNKLYHSAKW